MIIYGAGMAGLIAGNMLRRFEPVIKEAQPSLPNNHAALLRFRSDIASKATTIPFKKVKVQKSIYFGDKHHSKSTIYFNNMYSNKVADKVMGRSISNLDDAERYIAPEYFLGQMAKGVDIEFNQKLNSEVIYNQKHNPEHDIISTIPMPMLMDLVKWPDKPEFKWNKIWSVWGKINKPDCDVYQTVYFPDSYDSHYRISITGNIYIAEYITEPTETFLQEKSLKILRDVFGIVNPELENLHIKKQEYGKLLPIDEKVRKEFILYMTDQYRIYSLGRFATWRQILLDDIVEDVHQIEKLVEFRDDYKRRLNAR